MPNYFWLLWLMSGAPGDDVRPPDPVAPIGSGNLAWPGNLSIAWPGDIDIDWPTGDE